MLYLNNYHFAPAIINIINQIDNSNKTPKIKIITILPEKEFEKPIILKRAIKQILNSI